MFFLGLLLGVGGVIIITILFITEHPVLAIIAIGGVFVGFGFMCNEGYEGPVGTIVGGTAVFVVDAILRARERRKSRAKPTNFTANDELYINHCWNCGAPIDSHKNKKCDRCHTHYICSNCGMCYCDDPRNKMNNAILENSQGGTKMIDINSNEFRKFYFDIRMMEICFNQLNQNKLLLDKSILSLRNKYLEPANKMIRYMKQDFTMVKPSDIIRDINQFFDSIYFAYNVPVFDAKAVARLALNIGIYRNVGLNLDYLQSVEIEAWFLAVCESLNH